ncbi:unnamed protein product, partial [Rotaria sp. Silwood1]
FDFRVLLLKLQDYLSDNDRRRLHFIVDDTIPRHLRDDSTLGGTLSLLESLFDQAKISEQDFNYLIRAFNEKHYYEGVKRLQDVLIIREGMLYGESLGGDQFDDTIANSLTLNEKLMSLIATWSFDTLNSITFIYSNGKKITTWYW